MSLASLRRLVHDDFSCVDELIKKTIKSDVETIENLSNYILESGGKRLRPLLTLLSAHACAYKGRDHIKLAAMMEFFHTATLLHDDVIDESSLRRGRKTANGIWGSKASILVGDYLFVHYMHLAIDIKNWKIIEVLTQIFTEITQGEIRQLQNSHRLETTIEDYFAIIRSKTSLLFAGSAVLGALISDSNDTVYESLFNFGIHVGNAFQIIDDALDYCSTSEAIGKNIGDDLADGKLTLPLFHALNNCNDSERKLIEDVIKNGKISQLQEIKNILNKTNSIQYCYAIAQEEIDKAITSLTPLAQSPYKDSLIDLANYAINREY